MGILRGFLSISNVAKLISVISLIGLIFSILPEVHISTPTSFTGPFIVKLDVCHGSTAGIQKVIDTDFVVEGADPVGPLHSVGINNISGLIPSPLLIVFQEYPPPESAS
jgi:hypothetical protein